jgi:predicted 3-demethylubiquinone-9 3-methyltransferase (glyoxalase superfamily)
MNFYVSVFKNSKVLSVTRYGKEGPGPEGTVMTANFMIEGQEFVALNGGPQFHFTESISFVVNCENQKEIDDYWEKLSEDGGRTRAWLGKR